MRSRVYLTILTVNLLQACSPPPPAAFSDVERAAIAEAVQLRLDGYCEAAMNQDLDYLNGFWADTPDFVFAGDGELHTGYSFIRDSNQAWFAGLAESLYCSMSNGQVHVFGPDAASLATEYEWGVVTLEGDTVRAHGSWMYVFGFVDEDWRVVHSAGTHLYD